MAAHRNNQLGTRRFDDIFDPEASAVVRRLSRVGAEFGGPGAHGATIAAGLVAFFVGLPAVFAGGAGFVVAALLAVVVGAVAAYERRQGPRYVSGILPRFDGQEIVGEGLDLLIDISKRFAFARRKIDELPDLIQWSEVSEAVEAIRFDAARHAAGLSRTEAQWNDVRNAPEHSPQAVLRDRVARRRSTELKILRDYQRTADRLMNRAADAVAAATIASELGYDLEVAAVAPGAAEATLRLERAVTRLEALTAAWRALDSSTDLQAADLAAEQARRERDAFANAARLRAGLGDHDALRPSVEQGGDEEGGLD